MTAQPKLTKKQKKALAFRQRKDFKEKAKDNNDVRAGMEDAVVLLAENAVHAGLRGDEMEVEEVQVHGKKAYVHKGSKSGDDPDTQGQNSKQATLSEVQLGSRKRKRQEHEEVSQSDSKKTKKATDSPETAQETSGKREGKDAKQRFILFVGNLKYTTTIEAIKAHFSKCGKAVLNHEAVIVTHSKNPPPLVRLLTPKQSSAKPVVKSKGCAFLEFTHRNALQQALKLHQSELDGRLINVELTVGGGGKGEARLSKLRGRNKGLWTQRSGHTGNSKGSENTADDTTGDKRQRYSSTSGADHEHKKRKTWTVGDVDGEADKKRNKKSKDPSKKWVTGVNAIPVG